MGVGMGVEAMSVHPKDAKLFSANSNGAASRSGPWKEFPAPLIEWGSPPDLLLLI